MRESHRATLGKFCKLLLVTIVLLLMGACGDGEPLGADEADRLGQVAQNFGAASVEVEIALPGGLRPTDVALAATDKVRIADRARAEEGDGDLAGTQFGTVVSLGTQTTELGVSSKVGELWSQPAITLAQNATVEGDARSEGTISLSFGADVTGVKQAQQPLGATKTYSFTVDLPASGSALNLEPGQTVTLAPGSSRGSAMIKSSATLNVEGGSYFFDSMSFEPNSRLVLDDTEPVIFYVRENFTWRGGVEREGDPEADKLKFLVVILGNNTWVPIERSFRGTVLGPNAHLLLQPLPSGEHWGAFFGKEVRVEPDVVINHHRFPWSGLLPAEPIDWLDPVTTLEPLLGGSEPSAVETDLESPVLFEVPEEVWVQQGNAGNGTLTISFTAPGGAEETCTYQGGSPVAHPETDLDRAKGRRYLFPSCTGTIQPGGKYLVDWVRVEVLSADPESSGTAVSVPVGPGCQASLPPPMTPEEVVAARQDFDWLTVDELPEVDPDGNPALWHALIYIDNVAHDSADPPVLDQLDALDTWQVYYSTLPLSKSYVAEFDGKCGRVEHATDGRGVVVYAVLPAKLYNILRSFSIEAVLEGVEPPFKFIIPSSPEEPEYVNSDGSLDYAALGNSGYADWLAMLPPGEPFWGQSTVNKVGKAFKDAGNWVVDNVIDPVSEGGQEGFSYVTGGWDAAIDWTANALDTSWEQVQLKLADFVGVFSEKVDLTFNFSFLNRDPALPPGSPIVRLWGDRFTPVAGGIQPALELIPKGSKVRVRQWGWGFLPVLNEKKLSYTGTPATYQGTTVEVLRDDDGRGGGGALCVELDNPDAMMTTNLIPYEVCSFGFGLDDIPKAPVDVPTDNLELHAMTQIVDSAEYAEQVIGYDPHKAEVLIGYIPNELTGIVTAFDPRQERAMTLCLDFPSVAGGGISTLVGGLGGAGGLFGTGVSTFAGPVLIKDMWWPDEGGGAYKKNPEGVRNSANSRGVMTHEYGHFLMCSMMYDHEHGSALTALIERTFEGQNSTRSDDVALATEAWADTFTMQVVGGSNYITALGARSGAVSFCTDSSDPCMELNYRGVNDYNGLASSDPDYPFYDELARYQSLIHDAFDRPNSNARGTLAPWNGDVFANTTPLQFSPTGYLTFDDESVSLPGPLWFNWAKHFTDRSATGVKQLMRALSLTMEDNDDDWCNRCDLFALHEENVTGIGSITNPSADRAPNPAARWTRWELCAGSDRLTDILGAPEEPFLNIDDNCDPCDNQQFANNGVCDDCAADEVGRGDHCETCPPGTVPAGSGNQCTGCGPNEISVGGDCVPCRQGEGADKTTNTCVECPADVVIDWNDATEGECYDTAVGVLPANYAAISPPGDVCLSELWYEVTGLDHVVARGGESIAFLIDPAEAPDDQVTCNQRQHQLEQYRFADTAEALWDGVETHIVNGAWNPIPGVDPCTWVGLSHTVTEAEINAGLQTVRFVARSLDLGVIAINTDAFFVASSFHGAGANCTPE